MGSLKNFTKNCIELNEKLGFNEIIIQISIHVTIVRDKINEWCLKKLSLIVTIKIVERQDFNTNEIAPEEMKLRRAVQFWQKFPKITSTNKS